MSSKAGNDNTIFNVFYRFKSTLCRNKTIRDAGENYRIIVFISQFHENEIFSIKMDPCIWFGSNDDI